MARWVKRIGGEEIPMAVNSYLEDDFKNVGRYEADIETPEGNYKNVIFKLKIKGKFLYGGNLHLPVPDFPRQIVLLFYIPFVKAHGVNTLQA